ncbi:MAG: hypothetical protein HYX32_00250 [Actinobacteria bacterium]|nr:hypothetical protein [Actinomycetota bacterium]
MSVLAAIALFFLLLFVVLLVVIGVLVGMAGWRLDRRNRVDADRSSPAPVSWLVLPTEAAVLHRRLRDAAIAARRLGPMGDTPPAGSVDDVRQKLLQQAALLDRDVYAAGRAPRRHRKEMMKTIRPQVHEIESLTKRVAGLRQRAAGPNVPAGVDPPPIALHDIAERTTLLENAEAEVARVERASGLLDAERLIRESPPPPSPPPPSTLRAGPSQPIPPMPQQRPQPQPRRSDPT